MEFRLRLISGPGSLGHIQKVCTLVSAPEARAPRQVHTKFGLLVHLGPFTDPVGLGRRDLEERLLLRSPHYTCLPRIQDLVILAQKRWTSSQ